MDTGAPFPDNSTLLFGREPDLLHLQDRVKYCGLTAVVARPQMGKTWLLQELGRRLSVDPDQPYLVGYFESRGEGEDSLLRALIDLYTRWLSNGDYLQQAKMVWAQNKGQWLSGVTDAVTSVLDNLGTFSSEPIAKLIGKTLQGLTHTNTTLQTAGMQIQPLQYDQARDLLRTIAAVTQRPMVLVLDGWEQSRTLEVEAAILHSFLRHVDEWPQVHIFIGMRQEPPATTQIDALVKDQPTRAERYALPIMQLDEHHDRQALLDRIRQCVGIAAELTDEALLKLVDGYPAVVSRWTDAHSAIPVDSIATLKTLAEDAHANRFREFERLLPALEKADERPLAMRLALLPTVSEDWWQQIKNQVLMGLDEDLLEELWNKNILQQSEPPSYGHNKRWDAAHRWFQSHRPKALTREAETLIIELAAQNTEVSDSVRPYALSMLALRAYNNLSLSPLCVALLEANASFFGEKADSRVLIEAPTHDANKGVVAPLLAKGLYNTLTALAGNDPDRRDALLDKLRDLAAAHPDDAVVREQLAWGLFNTLYDVQAENDPERRDELLDELRDLSAAHPDDAAVREMFGKGLYNTHHAAKGENNWKRRDELLDELRDLAAAHPDDAAVRERLARGLFNTLVAAQAENDSERRDERLDELRDLAAAHGDDAVVRESLAMGLGVTARACHDASEGEPAAALIEELMSLTHQYPDDARLQEVAAEIVQVLEDTLPSSEG